MFDFDYQGVINSMYSSIILNLEFYAPKIIGALLLLIIGIIIAIIAYKFVLFAFKKFKIIELIDKLTIDFEDIANLKDSTEKDKISGKNIKIEKHLKFSQRVKLDEIFGKAVAYYVALIFFRLAIVIIGIDEVEQFLGELLKYLPSLFIAVVIGFFGVRFANLTYEIIFQTLKLTKQKTAKIIASGSRIIVLFFTLMVVLDKAGIASDIITIILTGFVGMLTLAGGIAFGLGGKEVAQEILESFRK